MNCKFRFIVLSLFLQCYRLISLSDGTTNFKTLKIDVTDWFKGNCFVLWRDDTLCAQVPCT